MAVVHGLCKIRVNIDMCTGSELFEVEIPFISATQGRTLYSVQQVRNKWSLTEAAKNLHPMTD